MTRLMRGLALIAATTLGAGPLLAADPAGDPVPVGKDLTAVIALQGLPCGKVVATKNRGDNDYIATCQDGHVYHVFVNPEGRVVVQKQ